MSATLPPSVAPLTDALLAGVRDALGDNLLGFYLRGSLALGGFDPESSDVDILIVTERPLSEAEFEALKGLHERLSPDGNEYGLPYDLAYLDRPTVRRFAPGRRCAKVGPGEPLHRESERPNWVLERWTVREHGIVVFGPDPKTLIDPVSPGEVHDAIRDELRERLRCWTERVWDPEDLQHVGVQAFEVETVCRALYTLRSGGLSTKQDAIDWALKALPRRWHDLIRWSQTVRGDRTLDATKIDEVMRFLAWAVTQATEHVGAADDSASSILSS